MFAVVKKQVDGSNVLLSRDGFRLILAIQAIHTD